MGEQIISASGVQHGLIVNPDGTINIGSIIQPIIIGSVSAVVESVFVQSGAINTLGPFIPETYGFIQLGYTGSVLTNVDYFKTSGGTFLGSILLTYDLGSHLIAVESTVV